MAQFLLTYLEQPQMTSPEEGKAHMGKWMNWLTGLGEAVVYPASPVKRSKVVGPYGVSDEPVAITGFLIVEADDIEAAVKIAQSDPFSDHAKMAVSELMVMGG
ncbi:YciI family protein [Planktomarina temperata]|nr:YciI family protein [Planktomarina temperata]